MGNLWLARKLYPRAVAFPMPRWITLGLYGESVSCSASLRNRPAARPAVIGYDGTAKNEEEATRCK